MGYKFVKNLSVKLGSYIACGSTSHFAGYMCRRWIDDGAASLLKLANKVDASVIGAPAFCAVITPGGYAYRREDGVLVLPVTCLAP